MVNGYYSNGNRIFESYYYSAWYEPYSFTANSSGTVYLRVSGGYSNSTGTYLIVYNTTGGSRPGF